MIRVVLALVTIAGCSIKDVDLTGKACPCPDGWVCAADNTCQRSVTPGDDAPIVHPDVAMMDTPLPATSCLTAPYTTVKYATMDFSDYAITWQSVGGAWSVGNNALAQTDKVADLSYAYHTMPIAQANYRIVSTMKQTQGAAGGALEIAFRIDDVKQSMYHCNYQPNDGLFLIQHTDNAVGGGSLMEIQLGNLTTTPFTMEVQVTGNQLECCIDNVAGAHITVTNSLYATGLAGVKTYRMAGGFTSFALLQ